jgi:hypothetical protein
VGYLSHPPKLLRRTDLVLQKVRCKAMMKRISQDSFSI